MSEFRKDPFTGRWRLIASGRAARPNDYSALPTADGDSSDCPFCEGHESRTPPEVAAVRPVASPANGPGWAVRSIPNRFPTVSPAPESVAGGSAPLFQRAAGAGVHEVIIESATHTPDLAYLPAEQLRTVFRFFRERVRFLTARQGIGAVLLFENLGPESGGTLRHPHAQLVATELVPPRLEEEREGFHRAAAGRPRECLLESVVAAETAARERIVSADETFTGLAPFASEFPYEVWLIPRRHTATFAEASDAEVDRLATLLPAVLRALEAIRPHASYNWFVHGLASLPAAGPTFHWHVEIAPRLVRPDGFELGGGISVNPVPPESAAAEVRAKLATGDAEGARKP